MGNQYTKEEYIDQLKAVYEKEKRYPKKSDFSELDAARIKSFFGPWPRALEAAGITPSKAEERAEKKRLKKERKMNADQRGNSDENRQNK